jgi:hypothetical protein
VCKARKGIKRQRRECAEALQRRMNRRPVRLMLREHLINLVEAMIEKDISESLQRTEPEQKLRQRKNP